MAWLIRLILIPAGTVAGWFVAKDAPNFGAVQTMVAVFLLVFILLVFGLSPRRPPERVVNALRKLFGT